MRSVIYSADSEFVSAFHNASLRFSLGQERVQIPADLIRLCTSQTVDLLVMDLDSATNATDMLPIVKRESANREVVIFAASNQQRPEAMISMGASLAMTKPVSMESASRHLRDALLITNGERRQFNRVAVTGPMHMKTTADGKIEGQLVNIGEGGLALKLSRVPTDRATVEIAFTLPGEQVEFHAAGKITWADPVGNVGIRFGALEPATRYRLFDWIAKTENLLVNRPCD